MGRDDARRVQNVGQSEPFRVFIGVDVRQPIAYTVAQSSIARHSSVPVSITPLLIHQLPIKRRGLTDFTFARFLVPWLCNYEGSALFIDADTVVQGNVAELASTDDGSAVQLVKNKQRFEWPSVMLFHNERCKDLTPSYIDNEKSNPFSMEWGEIGELPSEWNVLVGYDEPIDNPKLIHYTMGIPDFPEVRNLPYGDIWHEEKKKALSNVSWIELMGGSVHRDHVLKSMGLK